MWVFEEEVDGEKLTEIINTTHENVKYLPVRLSRQTPPPPQGTRQPEQTPTQLNHHNNYTR